MSALELTEDNIMHSHSSHPVCCIIPPHILRKVAESGTTKQKAEVFENLALASRLRGQREVIGEIAAFAATPAGTKRRTIYDARHNTRLPGRIVRGEGNAKVKDKTVNEAYDGAGKTYDFYLKVFQRNSIDNRGMRLDSTVHYGRDFDNAFWNGRQMVYGDGDGQIFERFTKCLEVIAHELTHGVTQFEAGLEYQDQPGALNESFSDVFGTLVKQYARKQTVEKADWLIGAGLFTKKIKGVALRSMKAPGTAYDDPVIGKDPQPAHMDHYVRGQADHGGVHINSGIPNRAFYELAVRLGGYAWQKAGPIWYVTLTDKLDTQSQFQDCADATFAVAGQLYGTTEQQAVREAWAAVGITTGKGRPLAAGAGR